MTTKITKKKADELWTELREGFINIERTIIAIIEAKAWEPLGYESFVEAWQDRMTGFRLVGEVRAHVVYAMFSEGADADAISATTGIGAGSVNDLKRQRSNGVPPEAATLVRQHARGRARPPYRLIVEFTAEERERYAAACKALDTSMDAEAAEVLHAHFNALVRLSMKEAS